jgi:hypothetical protein
MAIDGRMSQKIVGSERRRFTGRIIAFTGRVELLFDLAITFSHRSRAIIFFILSHVEPHGGYFLVDDFVALPKA